MKRLTTMLCGLGFGLFISSLLLLAGCAKEEAEGDRLPDGKYPMTFTASVEGLTATRATTDNSWAGGEEVAVQVGSNVKKYRVASGGALTVSTPDDPHYWTNNTMTVQAWLSHTNPPTRPTTFSVKEDQSGDGYQQSDMLYTSQSITFNTSTPAALTFKHLPVKVVVNLKAGDGVTEGDVQGATVTIENQATTSGTIAEDGTVPQVITGSTSITPNTLTSAASAAQKSVQALLVPQQMQGKKFIRVTINSNNYYYTPTNDDANLTAGNQYTYTITVKKHELEVAVKDNGAAWNDKTTEEDATEAAKFHIRGGDDMTLAAGDGGTLTDQSGYKELSGTNLLKVTVAKQADKFLKDISVIGMYTIQSWKSDATNYEIIYQLKGDVTLTSQDFVDKPTLEVGSYYYADGEWSTKLWSKPCIGIVFKAGKADSDTDGYTDMSGTTMSTINGYVVALEDVNSGTLAWANKNGEYSVQVGTSTSDSDWKGYSNCQTIKSYTTDGWSIKNFPAANACLNFGTADSNLQYAAPTSSSGWFLPSAGQLKHLYDNCKDLPDKIDKLKSISGYEDIKWFSGGYYWSSSESNNDSAYRALLVSFGDGSVYSNNKNYDINYVRGVFAF